MLLKAIALSLIMFISGCAYYEQVVGSASAYYDAKVGAWFKGACTLNQGAMGRVGAHRRSIINAACPPRTEPAIILNPESFKAFQLKKLEGETDE